MDIANIHEQRKKRIKQLNKKKLHGWKCNTDEHFFKKLIYSKYDDNSYVEVTTVTETYENPYPDDFDVTYVGLVNEYLGVAPKTPNILTTLLTKLYSEVNNNSIC